MAMLHHSHPDVIKRLKRAHGHLAKVISMIEDRKDCLLLAQQMHAVEKAVTNAKAALIHDHLQHCLDELTASDNPQRRRQLDDFKAIAKYLS